MANYRTLRLVYRAGRALTIVAAILWLFASFASQFVLPELYYEDGRTTPPLQARALAFTTSVVVAVLLSAPYRWTVRGWLFTLRLTAFGGLSLWLVVASAGGLVGYARGTKHWLVVPVSCAFVTLAFLLPAGLILARKLYLREAAA